MAKQAKRGRPRSVAKEDKDSVEKRVAVAISAVEAVAAARAMAQRLCVPPSLGRGYSNTLFSDVENFSSDVVVDPASLGAYSSYAPAMMPLPQLQAKGAPPFFRTTSLDSRMSVDEDLDFGSVFSQ